MFSITEDLKKGGKKKVILDTDTYNEIDDQFALALAMLSPDEIELLAVTAAPFHNENSSSYADGMERSYLEAIKVMELVHKSHGVSTVPCYRGSTERMPDPATPVKSEAADAIYRIANANCDDKSGEKVYVVAIGAITNVTSALLLYPDLADKIAVIWLGAHARWYGGNEFNLQGDLNATNGLLRSRVPLMILPCSGVASELILEIHELEYQLKGKSILGDYLCENVANCKPGGAVSWSRVIWDVGTIAAIVNPNCWYTSVQPRFQVNADYSYSFGAADGTFEHIEKIYRDAVFSTMFSRLR